MVIIEVDDYNDKQLIVNVSKSSQTPFTKMEKDMEPTFKEKHISAFELWRFEYDMFFIENKDRIVVSEKREKDIAEFKDYCAKYNINIDDLLYTILTS